MGKNHMSEVPKNWLMDDAGKDLAMNTNMDNFE